MTTPKRLLSRPIAWTQILTSNRLTFYNRCASTTTFSTNHWVDPVDYAVAVACMLDFLGGL